MIDEVDADEQEIRKLGLIATAEREAALSEREQIARMVERMYGPHDKRFKTATKIADAIRKGK